MGKGVYIRVYLLDRHEIINNDIPSSDKIASIIWNLIESGLAVQKTTAFKPTCAGAHFRFLRRVDVQKITCQRDR